MRTGSPFGIGVKILNNSLYLKVKEGGWKHCVKNAPLYPDIDLNYFAIVSNNQKTPDRVSNIDIDSIQFYNYDATAYQDKKALEAEALELSANNKNIR